MRFYRDRFAFVALVTFLLVGANAPAAPPRPPGPMHPESIVQPFLITFDRHEVQVIAVLANHPVYEAIEVMVTRRTGRPPCFEPSSRSSMAFRSTSSTTRRRRGSAPRC
ncbi:hypothetical protein ACN28S_11000 [Cystobacter fuscus]